MDNMQSALDQFESHVPYSSEAFMVLKAHLVIEMRLLEFIKARISSLLYEEIEKQREGAFQVRLLLARALAERDEIPPDNQEILWPALAQLGRLRNDVAHLLEHKGTSLQDKMADFIRKVDPSGNIFCNEIPANELHRSFHQAANYLNALFAIHCDPLLLADELQNIQG